MNMAEDPLPIVIDNGSAVCKIGFGESDFPQEMFPSYIGQHLAKSDVNSICKREFIVGDDAQGKTDLSFSYPIEHGIISNWDDMEKIWNYAFFKKLCVVPEEHSILLTEAPLNPKVNRERLAQTMFETFNFPAISIISNDVLALETAGRTCSIVIGIGDGVTYIVPRYEGHTLPHAIKRLDIGGRDLTRYLMKLLSMKNLSFSTTAEQEIVRDIKEKLCYVAVDANLELHGIVNSSTKQKTYNLPNGDNIMVGDERFKCPEALFQPSLLGIRSPGIHELLYDAIMQYDIDIRKDMLCNIILCGGTSCLPGIAERMRKEMSCLMPSTKLRILDSYSIRERQCFEWIGGSILASLSYFKPNLIKRKEYDEYGPSIVLRNGFWKVY